MVRTSPRTSWLTASLVAVAMPAWLAAQDGEDSAFDRTAQDCLIVQSVDDTDALDDQNIIFRMRNDKVYRNTLPRKCPGLERENRFMYEARGGRLCSTDMITVLEVFALGPSRGFTCRLGKFVPLSAAEVEDLDLQEQQQTRGRARRGIEARPVELPAEPAAQPEPAGDAAEEPAPAE